jgi:hypothetical protein
MIKLTIKKNKELIARNTYALFKLKRRKGIMICHPEIIVAANEAQESKSNA